MLWLGLAISALYVPGVTGASVQTSWAVLSFSLPALALWRAVNMTVCHWAVVAWAVLACISIAWALNSYDAVWGAWGIILFALAFYIGDAIDFRKLLIGFAIGANLSALFALLQASGIHLFMENNVATPSGFYFNSMYAGEIFALAILGAVIYRVWPLVILPSIALVLTHSHAGWLALAIGLVSIRIRSWTVIALILTACAAAFTFHFRPSDAERMQIWYATVSNMTLFGYGPGSMLSMYYITDSVKLPEYAHNDVLQLIFEYGVFSIIPIAALLMPAIAKQEKEWPLYVAFLVMGLVSFPLYSPITMVIGAVSAGRLSRVWSVLRYNFYRGGYAFLPGTSYTQSLVGASWRDAVPLVSRT